MNSFSAFAFFVNKIKTFHVAVQNENLLQELVPAKGMQFTSYAAAQNFYNTYARHAGFGTRKGGRYRTNNYIVCSSEGKPKETVERYERKREKTTKRIGCKAKIRVKEIKGVFLAA